MPTQFEQTEYRVQFTAPPEFKAIDLTEAPEERLRRTITQTAVTLPDLPVEQRAQLAISQELMAQQMAGQNVKYAATCVLRTEGERPQLTMANLTLVVQPVDFGHGADPLSLLANGLKTPGKKRETGYVHLPAGRALMLAEEVRLTPGITPFGLATDRTQVIRLAQAMVLFPDQRALAILGLSTEFLADWEDYVEIFRGIVRTIEFTRPGASTRIADRLGGF